MSEFILQAELVEIEKDQMQKWLVKDPPSKHLDTIFIRPNESVRGAKVGDQGVLEFRSSASLGLWYVREVL